MLPKPKNTLPDIKPSSTFIFLRKASIFYKDLCPEQSRFLMRRHQNIKALKDRRLEKKLNNRQEKKLTRTAWRLSRQGTITEADVCPFCFEWRRPGNHRVRLRAKRRASARVQAVLRREGRGKRLSLAQRELLRRFRTAPAVLMATCHSCNHTARSHGANRDLMATISRSHCTPGGTNKYKPPRSPTPSHKSTPRTPKDKTPFSTPRLNSKESSGSSSSSTPASVKKSPFARLKSFLMEDRQKTKKAGLKDFLSSL